VFFHVPIHVEEVREQPAHSVMRTLAAWVTASAAVGSFRAALAAGHHRQCCGSAHHDTVYGASSAGTVGFVPHDSLGSRSILFDCQSSIVS
jgi:hypothetical protein